jgi:hypothetical protein
MSKKRMDVNWNREVNSEDLKPALKRFRGYLNDNDLRNSTIDMYVFRAGCRRT